MRFYFSICYLFIVVCATCQDYMPIIKEDTTKYLFAHSQLSGKYIDTIYIGAKTAGWYEVWYKGQYYNGQKTYAGLVKSSSDNSILWSKYSDVEYVIYDINLTKNDSFHFNDWGEAAIVDSTYFQDNRKVVEFNQNTQWGERIKFIEGLGPNTSILERWEDPGLLNPFTVCQFELSNLIYSVSNKNFINCDFLTDNIPKEKKEIIAVFPNPFSCILFVSFEEIVMHDQGMFILYNVSGEKISEYQINKSQELKIDTKLLPPGIYFYKLQTNLQCITEIIIKQ